MPEILYINKNDSIVLFALSCQLWNGCNLASKCSTGKGDFCKKLLLLGVVTDKGKESELCLELIFFYTKVIFMPLWCLESCMPKET